MTGSGNRRDRNGPSVVVVTRSAPLTRRVVAGLAERLAMVGIVDEHARQPAAAAPPSSGWQRLVSRWSRWRRRTEAEVDRALARLAKAAMADYNSRVVRASSGWPATIPVHVTEDVNRPATVEWCRRLAPDVVVLLGCSIVRRPLLEVAGTATLNVHPSLLPEYRGWFSELWIVLDGRWEHAGVTVHHVDEGVDTGDIVLQRPLETRPDMDPYQLQVAGALIVPDLVSEAIRLVAGGGAERHPQGPSTGRVCRKKDLTPEVKAELLLRLRRRRKAPTGG